MKNKKTLTIISVIVLVLLLVCVIFGVRRISLARNGAGGVGGAGAQSEEAQEELIKEIAGSYRIVTIEGGEEGSLSEYDLELMKDAGMNVSIDIREDGNATMDFFGQDLAIKYDIETMTMQIEGGEASFSYDDGTLQIDNERAIMTFLKE